MLKAWGSLHVDPFLTKKNVRNTNMLLVLFVCYTYFPECFDGHYFNNNI